MQFDYRRTSVWKQIQEKPIVPPKDCDTVEKLEGWLRGYKDCLEALRDILEPQKD